MTINEHWVQFKGKFLLPEPIDREKYAIISGEFEHLTYSEKPNEDGTADAVYVVAPIRVMVQSGDKRLIAKVRKRNSQRLRGALWHHFQTLQTEEDFDTYYEEVTNKIISQLPEILGFIGK